MSRARQQKPCEQCGKVGLLYKASTRFCHGTLDPATNQIEVTSYKPNVPEKRGFAPCFDGSIQRGDMP